jgi:sialate O-acetylesterase
MTQPSHGVIRILFDSTSPIKSIDGAPLKQFTIAGADGNFVPANAKIDGNSVLVSSPDVHMPVAVRYAFKNNPQGCNLTNDSGLPAIPFRTDAP